MRLRTFVTLAIAGLVAGVVTAALAFAPTSVTQTGGLHFVGQPDVTATKTDTSATLTATGEVAGAGTSATAVLSADVAVTTGCINRGSKDQQPSGLQRTTTTTSGSKTFQTRSGRGTFEVTTAPVGTAGRTCPDQMTPVLVSTEFTNVTLTITSGSSKTLTATFPDIDP
jgi:hypothetical protein